MQEVIAEIVDVLKRHGVNVELDSAQIEWDGVHFVFRCKYLNREDGERKNILKYEVNLW